MNKDNGGGAVEAGAHQTQETQARKELELP